MWWDPVVECHIHEHGLKQRYQAQKWELRANPNGFPGLDTGHASECYWKLASINLIFPVIGSEEKSVTKLHLSKRTGTLLYFHAADNLLDGIH